jgi:hypothetical protein
MTNKEKTVFMQGYVCAVATLVHQHGNSTEARNLLESFGFVDWNDIDQIDKDRLREAGLII